MSTSITIQDLVLGNPNSSEDPKIASNFSAIKNWIASPALAQADLAANSVSSAKIVDGAVATAELAGLAVTEAKLASNAVTADKVASGVLAQAKFRPFALPTYVPTIPSTVQGSTTYANTTPVSSVAFTTSGVPQVGQLVTGTGVASDTVITSVTGSASPYTLGLSRATVQSAAATVTLTVAPQNGDEIVYAADSANGVNWHLRYNGSSSSPYKWEFIGGSPLMATAADVNITQPATPVYNAGSTTLSQALTYAGDYDITMGVLQNAKNNAYTSIALSGGTSAVAVDADAVYSAVSGTDSGIHLTRTLRKTISAAAVTVTMQHKGAGSQSAYFNNRSLRVTPVRVSA